MSDGEATGNGRTPLTVSLLHVATVVAPIRNFYVAQANHFRAMGWRVDAAAHGCTAIDAVMEAFSSTHELPFSRSLRDVASVVDGLSAIQDLIESTAPDIVHVHTPIASFVTRLAVRRIEPLRRPAVAYTAHGFHFLASGNPISNLAFRTAERVAGRWTDRLVVINDEDEDAARHWRIVPTGHLVRMRGVGIDTDVFSRDRVRAPDVARVRGELGIDPLAPLFVSVAELRPRKRHERTIEALSRMTQPDVHLAIAGEGRLRDHLATAARRLGVAERVHFLGWVDDVRPLLAAANGFILASEREGLARSLMEALSLEVPAIASDARGNAELVGEDSGFIVPGADPASLAAAMDRLIADPGLAQAMGQRGRARMASQYGQQTVIEMHERMYIAMLSERDARLRSLQALNAG